MNIKINDLTVSLGGREILSHADFEIKGREKIGIVGSNGAGKTTLIRVLSGEIVPDRDDRRMGDAVVFSKKYSIGTLKQKPFDDLSITVYEAMDNACKKRFEEDYHSGRRYEYESVIAGILTGLGFSLSIENRRLSEVSGGELSRIALAVLLAGEYDLLLLDEPTNHLDMDGVCWLEDYLNAYDGAVVIVSHDRFFLDRTVDSVAELSLGRIKKYPGNYSAYIMEKQKEYELALKAYKKYEEEKERLLTLIDKFKNKPTKASFARAKLKQLERIKEISKPSQEHDIAVSQLGIPEYLGPKWIYEAEKIKVGYDKELFEFDFKLKRGQRIGVIGVNGSGKTTLIKTIAGLLPALGGKQRLGNRVEMGYFDQKSGDIFSEKRVYDYFHDRYQKLTEADTRKILGMYGFRGKDVYKLVNELSGGEKSRLVLAALLQGLPNFLILDEPTNHMDIPSRAIIEKILKNYPVSQIIVSHDRYFLSEIADSLLIVRDGGVTYYPFDYRHYSERRNRHNTETIPGEISAEDAKLLSSVQNVPEKRAIQAREQSSEEQYIDWITSTAEEELENAFREYDSRMLKGTTISEWNCAEEKLTLACIRWYDEINI